MGENRDNRDNGIENGNYYLGFYDRSVRDAPV